MNTPLDTLLEFTDELQNLTIAEIKVLRVRHAFPTDQPMQLHMDRIQTEIDSRREEIEGAMVFIASMN